MLKKIISLIAVLPLLFITLPCAFAQTGIPNPLDNIKSRLGEDGIFVIDYSIPQNEWGSLSEDWVQALSDAEISPVKEMAESFENEFEGAGGINELRHERGVLEGQKTRAETEAERQRIQDEIDGIRGDLETRESAVKNRIRTAINGVEDMDVELGTNLLFEEIDFYYNYNKWSNVPYLVSEALKANSALWQGEDQQDLATLGKVYGDFSDASTNFGMDTLRDDLSAMTFTDEFGVVRGFNSNEMDSIINGVLATRFAGERELYSVTQAILNFMQNVLAGIAIIIIIYSAARMIFAQGDETVITQQKQSITYALLGLVAILLLGRIVDLLYGPVGVARTELLTDQTYNLAFDLEIYGLISFIKAIVGVVAIFFIIKSGVMSIMAQGAEDKIKEQRKAVIFVIVGLLLIIINRVIVENLYIQPINEDDQILASNVTNIVNLIGSVLTFFLGFVGIVALGILVYGAGLMLMNYGDEEVVKKGQTMIKNAIIGILVIIAAYTIVATLIVFR